MRVTSGRYSTFRVAVPGDIPGSAIFVFDTQIVPMGGIRIYDLGHWAAMLSHPRRLRMPLKLRHQEHHVT